MKINKRGLLEVFIISFISFICVLLFAYSRHLFVVDFKCIRIVVLSLLGAVIAGIINTVYEIAANFFRDTDQRKNIALKKQSTETEAAEQERFIQAYKDAFTNNAKVYVGMYVALQKIADDRLSSPEKFFREWCKRTRFSMSEDSVWAETQKHLVPLGEGNVSSPIEYSKWAKRLIQAASFAGVIEGSVGKIIINEENFNNYSEISGNELNYGDRVKIVDAAWFKDGNLLEIGHIKKE